MLGQISKGQTMPAFETALFAMREGDMSQEPVASEVGYHIIKVHEYAQVRNFLLKVLLNGSKMIWNKKAGTRLFNNMCSFWRVVQNQRIPLRRRKITAGAVASFDSDQGRVHVYSYDERMNKDDTNALLAKYDYPVPRYTSFPTAVQFKPAQDQDIYFKCLNKLTTSEPVSLYVHIPFCHSLCHYCGCHTKIVRSYSPISSYIDTLIKEIELAGRNLKATQSVSRIHFGGGSPNYAKTEDIKRILDTLGRYVDLSSAQIDMECDPRLLNEEKISDYAVLGLSRISLGIQDFDAGVQKAINRIQPFDMVKKQIEALHRNGIHNINFDLIIGLPEQTLVTVNETLDKVLELQPARVAVFPYAHVPWMKKHQKLLEKYEMPETSLRYEMAKLTETRLKERGI
jgi:hypothetical protein